MTLVRRYAVLMAAGLPVEMNVPPEVIARVLRAHVKLIERMDR